MGHGPLPAGEVTFAFTDVEASTQHFRTHGPAWPEILNRHRTLLRAALRAHGGHEVSTDGDGFFLAFDDAAAAIAFAAATQRAIAAEPWPGPTPLRVRIGLHTGEAEPTGDDYIAFPVHQAARVSAAAHGGQTLLTDATKRAAQPQAPGVTLVDLGRFHVRDFDGPTRLHEVHGPGIDVGLPPPRVPGERRTNLPADRTPLVGRTEELRALGELLTTHRLTTVVGTGGMGKTRLALAAARAHQERAADGVWFVGLSELPRGGDVTRAVAEVLEVRPEADQPLRHTLVETVASRRLLLVLDNCEHVADAAAELADALLATAPDVTVLATSRLPLRVEGEHVWTLPPLSGQDAHELFAARAAGAGRPPDPQDGAAIAQLCRRLDGLPLAIELAAARARVLAPAQLLARLDDDARQVLDDGATSRRPGLGAVVDWSHDLLTAEERVLFRRMAVFAGGATIHAVERVCAGDGLPRDRVPSALFGLVDHSLVTAARGGTGDGRYGMLETLRAYARAKLEDAGEAHSAREHHLDAMADFATAADTGLTGDDQERWFARAAEAQANVAEALGWDVQGERHRRARLQIAAGLGPYWLVRGIPTSDAWLRRAIEEGRGLDPELERDAAIALGASWSAASDPQQLARLLDGAGEQPATPRVVYGFALLCSKQLNAGDAAGAERTLRRGKALADALGHPWATNLIELRFAHLAEAAGDIARAERHYGEVERVARRERDLRGLAAVLLDRSEGRLMAGAGADDGVRDDLREAYELLERLGLGLWRPMVLALLGLVELEDGFWASARRVLADAVDAGLPAQNRYYAGVAAVVLGLAASDDGDHRRAAQLLGVGERLHGDEQRPEDAWYASRAQAVLQAAEQALGAERLARARQAGRELDDRAAVALARAVAVSAPAAG